jgi:hypothetical protein
MTDLPILEEYWTYDAKWGTFWSSLTREEKETLLAEPTLSHPDTLYRSEKFITNTVEERESVARFLKAQGKSPDDAGFRLYLRLLQICGEATRACEAEDPEKALVEVLGRRVLCSRARAQFAKENAPMFFVRSSDRTFELDTARFGAKRRFLSFLAIPEGKAGTEWERGQLQLRSGGDMNYFSGPTVTTLAGRILRHCLESGRMKRPASSKRRSGASPSGASPSPSSTPPTIPPSDSGRGCPNVFPRKNAPPRPCRWQRRNRSKPSPCPSSPWNCKESSSPPRSRRFP